MDLGYGIRLSGERCISRSENVFTLDYLARYNREGINLRLNSPSYGENIRSILKLLLGWDTDSHCLREDADKPVDIGEYRYFSALTSTSTFSSGGIVWR